MPSLQIENRWRAFYNQIQRYWKWDAEHSETMLFIGSSEILPPPLKPDEEAALVAALQDGSHDARQKLVEHNLRLVIYIAKRFENSGLNVEDLVSIGSIGLIKAVGTYDPAKGIKLATYASKCIENEILMYMRRSYRQKAEVSFEEPLNTDWDGNELLLRDIYGTDEDLISRRIEDETDRDLLHIAMSKLTEREQLIMNLRYGLNNGTELTQKQVADRLGISQSYISRLEKKIIKRLRKEFSRME